MPHHVHTRVSPPNNTPFYIITSVSCHQYITLPLSTWLNLSRATSLLGLCALLWMIKPCASPSSRENSMVVGSCLLLLCCPNLEFSSFCSLSQPFPPCLQNLPLQTVFWPVIAFSAAQNWNSASLFLFVTALAFKLVYTPPPTPPRPHILSHMCVHVWASECVLFTGIVCMRSCVCVWCVCVWCVCVWCVCVWVHTHTWMCAWSFVCVFLPCFVWKCSLIFICFEHLYTTDLYSYGYLHCMFFFKL